VSSARLALFVGQSVAVGLAAAFVLVLFFPGLLPRPQDPGAQLHSYAAAVRAAAPAVVNVYSARRLQPGSSPLPERDPPPAQGEVASSLGSGVIVDARGYILTNQHVVDRADQIRVQLADGRIADARVVGADNPTDLALLKIDLGGLPVMAMGRSDTLQIGDVVLAIGNPYGLGQTVTQGIVSATGRWQVGLTLIGDFIQTDAAINVGNSGGALVNARGELVGINIATLEPALLLERSLPEGIGFAIPVNLARGVMDQLIAQGRVIRGWLGVNADDITAERALELGLPSGEGIELVYVYPDSPASEAGLAAEDVITRIDGQPVPFRQSAVNIVARLQPGKEVSLSGFRQGKEFTATARVVERPE